MPGLGLITMMAAQAASTTLATPRQEPGTWALILPAVIAARESAGAPPRKDAHDRFAHTQPAHAAMPSNPRFVHFYTGAQDAEAAASGGAQASGHRRVRPLQFSKRIGKTGSVLVGVTLKNCAVGAHFPDLTLKRGTMAVTLEDATVTYCGESETAFSGKVSDVLVTSLQTDSSPDD